MFTGLVQTIGTVRSIDQSGDWRLAIETAMDLENISAGASICCSGCCLTVTEKGKDYFAVQVSQETLSKTAIKNWQVGTRVNIEPSLRLGDEIGGHFVFGHIDGIAVIEEITPDQDSHRLKIRAPKDLMRFIAPKGSVALDGISLTVNEVESGVFGVNIIPHTWQNTTLGACKPGDALNLEIDMLARYVARMMEAA